MSGESKSFKVTMPCPKCGAALRVRVIETYVSEPLVSELQMTDGTILHWASWECDDSLVGSEFEALFCPECDHVEARDNGVDRAVVGFFESLPQAEREKGA